jgi:DNA-directed RNA polymerase subunit omega
MGIPINKLIDSEENVYQTTCVAIKQAEKIVRPELEEGEDEGEKIISEAITMVLENNIELNLEETE